MNINISHFHPSTYTHYCIINDDKSWVHKWFGDSRLMIEKTKNKKKKQNKKQIHFVFYYMEINEI